MIVTIDSVLLNRIQSDIQRAFSTEKVLAFKPTMIFIATWSNVTYNGWKYDTLVSNDML
jgi:hypothetical protein